MSNTDAFLAQLHDQLEADSRIEAAWLGGSYGRGEADRYSDVDLHLLLAAGGGGFREGMEAWLNSLRPLVLYKLLFEGRMVNALTADGVRLDVWMYDQAPGIDRAQTRLLFDRRGQVQNQPAPAAKAAADDAATAAALRGQIEEFWRCIALTPTVIGRGERLVSWRGLAVEFDLVLDILLRGHAIVRDVGPKRLNGLLPPALREELEAAFSLQGLSPASLAGAHLALAGIVHRHGPQLAARRQFDYPAPLETAVMRYVLEELRLLGVDAVWDADCR